MNLNRFWAIIWKRMWMIVLLFAVTMIVILFGALTAKPVYEAAVRLQVIPMESEQVGLYGPSAGQSQFRSDRLDRVSVLADCAQRPSCLAHHRTTGADNRRETLLQRPAHAPGIRLRDRSTQADSPQTAEAIVNAQVRAGAHGLSRGSRPTGGSHRRVPDPAACRSRTGISRCRERSAALQPEPQPGVIGTRNQRLSGHNTRPAQSQRMTLRWM